ncbi:MAG TPA: thioredoxin family protein [Terracidiphilus sp.]|jgi:thiol:disulfide interchange protein|nr:thioredoxin family protein [Terracidiphilus sp.]
MEVLPVIKMRAFLSLAAALLLAVSTAYSATGDIYPAPEQAKADVAAALKLAAATHKRVLIDFGGNWCPDCHVLNIYFHDETNRPLLEANFVLVDVNIGHVDQNLDIAERFGVPLAKGVPALAVVSDKGKLLYSQQTGQFNSMRRMQSSAVTDFLEQWKPAR